jgi:hypothetical protein
MTKPISDKAEVALKYPDKVYIGTFAHTARFDAPSTGGIALNLELPTPGEQRKSVHMHFHYGVFAEILRDLAKTVVALPPEDILHREALRDSVKALYLALETSKTFRAGSKIADLFLAHVCGPLGSCKPFSTAGTFGGLAQRCNRRHFAFSPF